MAVVTNYWKRTSKVRSINKHRSVPVPNAAAKALSAPENRPAVIPPAKGRGSYRRMAMRYWSV